MSRENVKKAIEFRKPDQLPRYMHWYSMELLDAHPEEIKRLMEEYPDDLLQLPTRFPTKRISSDLYYDEWGCLWRQTECGVGAHLQKAPLSSLENLEKFLQETVPDVAASGLIPSEMEIRRLREEFPDQFLIGQCWRTYYERMWMLVGMEELMVELHLHPERVGVLEHFLREYTLQLIERWGKAGVDAIYLADDWGSQASTLIAPSMWRKVFKAGYKQMFEKAHEYSMYTFFHSDGNIVPIIEDLIEIGLDVLNPLQSSAIDIEKAAGLFGGRICFMGGLDVQHMLTEGTPVEIRQYVTRTVGILGSFDGGYIICPDNTLMPETPIENIRAACQAAASYGSRG
jgi:uroporphyrinogen decarboxylase